MDTQRSALLIVFLFSLFMLWDGWQRFNQPPAAPAVATDATAAQSAGAQAPVPTVSSAYAPSDEPQTTAVAQTAAARLVTDLFIADVSNCSSITPVPSPKAISCCWTTAAPIFTTHRAA